MTHSSASAFPAVRWLARTTTVIAAAAALTVFGLSGPTRAQSQDADPKPDTKPGLERQDKAPEKPSGDAGKPSEDQAAKPQPPEGSMTIARMDEIIRRLDKEVASPRAGAWQFQVSDRPVIIVTDQSNDRMRIIYPIGKVEGLPEGALKRLMQANFDTALDARYAIARGLVWSTYIHPLRALHDRQFISAIGQTVNLAVTFGTTFSSGAMSFGGGDSRGNHSAQTDRGTLEKGPADLVRREAQRNRSCQATKIVRPNQWSSDFSPNE